MSTYQFTDTQIAQWADEVSDQLNAITTQEALLKSRGANESTPSLIPEPQRAIIEAETGESAETFWERYKCHARLDLCQPDGNLNKLWLKYKDLPTKDVVKMSGSALIALNISTNLMGTVGVAASVVLLHVLLNIGIEAICEGCPTIDETSATVTPA